LLDDTQKLSQQLIHLENASPVVQAEINDFGGWSPILHCQADLTSPRARRVSMILQVLWRFDYQLEGESDLWFRHVSGSAQDSVASFGNALTLQCQPVVLKQP
jgi:hypothetical protein